MLSASKALVTFVQQILIKIQEKYVTNKSFALKHDLIEDNGIVIT